jgi:hypothetical protein
MAAAAAGRAKKKGRGMERMTGHCCICARTVGTAATVLTVSVTIYSMTLSRPPAVKKGERGKKKGEKRERKRERKERRKRKGRPFLYSIHRT